MSYWKIFFSSVFFTPIVGVWIMFQEKEKLAGIHIVEQYKCPECLLEFTDEQKYCPICKKSGKHVKLQKNVMKII